jgi:hypothetical protein
MTTASFYQRFLGSPSAPETLSQWLYIPSASLAAASNGEVFYDPLGDFSKIRQEIKNGMPEDVRLKKIASCALHMAQTGQYNYSRCMAHGESGAARLALSEFVRNGIEIVFLLNRVHMPYYKWAFRAMKELEILSKSASLLESLIDTSNDRSKDICEGIEHFCSMVIKELNKQNLSQSGSDYLEPHAYSINDNIKDHGLRNLYVML